MSEIKTLQEKIEGKFKMLSLTVEDTGKILETKDVKAIERHGSASESGFGKSGWHSGHQSRLPPLLQLLYLG